MADVRVFWAGLFEPAFFSFESCLEQWRNGFLFLKSVTTGQNVMLNPETEKDFFRDLFMII